MARSEVMELAEVEAAAQVDATTASIRTERVVAVVVAAEFAHHQRARPVKVAELPSAFISTRRTPRSRMSR